MIKRWVWFVWKLCIPTINYIYENSSFTWRILRLRKRENDRTATALLPNLLLVVSHAKMWRLNDSLNGISTNVFPIKTWTLLISEWHKALSDIINLFLQTPLFYIRISLRFYTYKLNFMLNLSELNFFLIFLRNNCL